MRKFRRNPLIPKKIAILAAIAIVLIFLFLYFLAWPTKIEFTAPGAEVDSNGNVITSGTMVIQGWKYNYLFRDDLFRLTRLELPGLDAVSVLRLNYPLYEMYPAPGNYRTFALIVIGQRDYSTDIYFSEDQSRWLIVAGERIFAGTTAQNAGYGKIMDVWHSLIGSLAGN